MSLSALSATSYLSTNALQYLNTQKGLVSGLNGQSSSVNFDTAALLGTAYQGSSVTTENVNALKEFITDKVPNNQQLLQDLDTIVALAETPVESKNLFSPYSIQEALLRYQNPELGSSSEGGLLSLLG